MKQVNCFAIMITMLVLCICIQAQPSIRISRTNAAQLANTLQGPGMVIDPSSIHMSMYDSSQVSFFEYAPGIKGIGLAKGVFLSTGMGNHAADLSGLIVNSNLLSHDTRDNMCGQLCDEFRTAFQDNDAGLSSKVMRSVTQEDSLDRVAVHFSFTPQCTSLHLSYVFASCEYRAYIEDSTKIGYNDVIGVFVRPKQGTAAWKNIALVPHSSLSVRVTSIHPANNKGVLVSACHDDLYTDALKDPTFRSYLQFHGYTIPLSATLDNLTPGVEYELIMFVADILDRRRDSGLFFLANSFTGSSDKVAGYDTTLVANCFQVHTLKLGQPAKPGVVYSWTPSEYLDATNTAQPTLRYTNRSADTVRLRYIVRCTNVSGCNPDQITDTVTVLVPPELYATLPADTTICAQSSIRLALIRGPHVQSRANVIWTSDRNNPMQRLSADTVVVKLNAGPDVVRVTLSDSAGCELRDSIRISVAQAPTVHIDKATLCTGSSTELQCTVSGVRGTAHYLWKSDPDLSGSMTASHVTVKPQSSGPHSFHVDVYDDQGCFGQAEAIVQVLDGPHISAGPDLEMACGEQSIVLGDSARITGGVGTMQIKWQTVGGATNGIDSPNTLRTVVHLAQSTQYELLVSDAQGCVARDTVTVRTRPIPDANAGPDLDICTCDPRPFSLGAEAQCGSGPFVYKWLSLDGSPLNLLQSTASAPTQLVLPTGLSQTVRYRYVLNVRDASGAERSDTVAVNLHPCPRIDYSDEILLCSADKELVLKPLITVEDSVSASFSWQPPIYLSNPTLPHPTIHLPADQAIQQDYSLFVRTAFGCTQTKTIRVKSSAPYGVHIRIMNPQSGCLCRGTILQLSAELSSGTSGSGLRYEWIGNGISSTQASQTTLEARESGFVQLRVTDAQGCSAIDSIAVCVLPVPNPEPGHDTTICKGSAVIRGDSAHCGIPEFHYAWSPTTGVSDPTSPHPVFSPTESTTYTLTVRDAGGAQSTAQLHITVIEPPSIQLSGPQPFCPGTSALVSISSQSNQGAHPTYIWTANGVIVQTGPSALDLSRYTQNTTISCTLTNDVGCSVSASIPVVVYEAPTIENFVERTVCACDSFALNAVVHGGQPPYSYLWTNLDGSPIIELGPDTSSHPFVHGLQSEATYVLRVRDANGCTDARLQYVQLRREQAAVQLQIPEIQTLATNKKLRIPVVVASVSSPLLCTPHAFDCVIRYDQRLYDPEPTLNRGSFTNTLDGVTRSIHVHEESLPALHVGDTLFYLEGAALLGDPGQCQLELDSMTWPCRSIQSHASTSTLQLVGLCTKPSDSTRLLDFNASPVLEVLPNPTRGPIHIIVRNAPTEECMVRIVDVQGQLILEKSFVPQKSTNNSQDFGLTFDEQLTSGIYLCEFLSLTSRTVKSFEVIH